MEHSSRFLVVYNMLLQMYSHLFNRVLQLSQESSYIGMIKCLFGVRTVARTL